MSLANPHSYSAAAGDYNNDDLPDLFISHHGPFSLWENNGNGTFSDVSSIIEGRHPADKHGVSLVDLNRDGFIDIAISVGGDRGRGEGKNIFFLNQQGKTFIREASPSPLIEYAEGRGRSIVPADINHDGNIDLLLMNYIAQTTAPPHRLVIDSPSKNLTQLNSKWSSPPLREQFSLAQAFGCSIISLDDSGQLSFILSGPGRDAGRIFRQINGQMTDVTSDLGINHQRCMSVTPIDFDNDGDLDLFYGRGLPPPSRSVGVTQDGSLKFVINYNKSRTKAGFKALAKAGKITIDVRFEQRGGSPNLYIGMQKKAITLTAPLQIDLADYDLQGEPRIDETSDNGGFLWRDKQTDYLHYIFLGSESLQETEGVIQPIDFQFSSTANINIPEPTTPHDRNSLYKNENGHFVDVADKANILGSGQVFTSIAADFNNDGFIDVYTVNIGQSFYTSNLPNHLFLNNGDGTFKEVAAKSGAAGPLSGIGSGAIAFDYNEDGKIDIFLHNGNTIFPQEDGPLVLLKNVSPNKNKSVQVSLKSADGSQGWGTKILTDVGGTTLQQQKYALNGYLATSDLPIHVGLGHMDEIGKLHVVWPSGKKQDLSHVIGPRIILIEQEQ